MKCVKEHLLTLHMHVRNLMRVYFDPGVWVEQMKCLPQPDKTVPHPTRRLASLVDIPTRTGNP